MSLLLYCRPGFEKECAAEIMDAVMAYGVSGYVKAKAETGYVLFVPHDARQLQQLGKRLPVDELVFARQCVQQVRMVSDLPTQDRVTPIVAAAAELASQFSAVWLETADTNAAKELSAFCRKFAPPLTHGLRQAGLLDEQAKAPRLHLFWLDSSQVYLGITHPKHASPWPMGIPRLKLSRHAPSRSALKLAEAFLTFLNEQQTQDLLHEGLSAVDLGAAPGGWTWQLVQHGLHVTAVDNGALEPNLARDHMVEHVRTDGFHYWPKRAVDWLVCDMVEKPARIAELIAHWAVNGKCKQAIFNLKLPMKKRWEEYLYCREILTQALDETPHLLRFRHLYHDREEITGFLQVLRHK